MVNEEEIRRNEHRTTVLEQDFKAILYRLDELSSNHKSLTQAVSTWANAQKEQNHNVAVLQKDFNDNLRDRNLNRPLLDAHIDAHATDQKVKDARKSVWVNQWKVISAAASGGGAIVAAIFIILDKVIGI